MLKAYILYKYSYFSRTQDRNCAYFEEEVKS
jgi:hypothetical protein